MASALTKHRPGQKVQGLPSNAPMRSADLSCTASAPDTGDFVSLGSREPTDGRYVSLVRSTYRHASVKPTGEPEVSPQSAEQITMEKIQRTRQHREKQFYLGPSEDELSRFMSSQRGTPSPCPRAESSLSDAAQMVDPEESRKNATAMRACHVYVSTKDQDFWKHHSDSSMRSNIGKDVASAKVISVDDRNSHRDGQRSTHFHLGFHAQPSTSESRGQYQGTQSERVRSLGARSSALQLGMSIVNVPDTLRSLKQLDFVPHNDAIKVQQAEKRQAVLAGNAHHTVTAETDSLVLGYADVGGDGGKGARAGGGNTSLYRASYTPVHFNASPQRQSRMGE